MLKIYSLTLKTLTRHACKVVFDRNILTGVLGSFCFLVRLHSSVRSSMSRKVSNFFFFFHQLVTLIPCAMYRPFMTSKTSLINFVDGSVVSESLNRYENFLSLL
jgi:hypothetical protein